MNNIRKTAILAALFAIVVPFFLLLRASAQTVGGPTAEYIYEKTLSTYDGINSVKYTWYAEGMDTFTKDRQKQMSGNYDSLAKKAGVEQKVEVKPKLVRGKYEIKYMKPYLQQMYIIKSDFVPKIIWGTLLTYRSDKDQTVWWAKPKISPIAIKRSVEKDDAGGALTSNWTVALLDWQYYRGNSDISIQPEGEYDGKKCYVVRFTFDWKKRPQWNHKKPPFEKYDVPEPVKNIIWKDMLDIEKQKFSYIDYYIDKEKFWLLDSEEYINGKFHWRNGFRNVEVDTLTEKDF
jgi:hypothetical protein